MRFTFSFETDANGQTGAQGPVTVGWLLKDPRAGILYDPPVRVQTQGANTSHAKSAARCPAVLNMESRYFEVPCPFDLQLQLKKDEKGGFVLGNLQGNQSAIRNSMLQQVLKVSAPAEWRFPDKPVLQLQLPYIFVADEPVYLTQTPPFMKYVPQPLPGVMFTGRFPIHVWPRPLVWAFEWHDTAKPLILKRGMPLLYVGFETTPQDRPTRVVRAERTPELEAYMDLIGGAVNFVGQTFSLFEKAAEQRPAQLLREAKTL